METLKDGSDSSTRHIVIDRVSYFRQFETPSLMKCTDELTFYNNGEELSSVKYTLNDFLPSLHIFDSTGNQLEFYGSTDSKNKKSLEINIDFPYEKPFYSGEYRTIRLEYIQEAETLENLGAMIIIPLHENASIYTFIEQCEHYEFIVRYGILDKGGEVVDNTNLNINRGDSFFHIYFKVTQNNNSLYLHIEHKIAKTLSRWYNMGAAFGIISFISIPILYHYNPLYIRGIATSASFVISYLFIIKGWLFSKNMDKKLQDHDSFYKYLIWLIFLEVIFMLLHYSIKFI